MLEAEGARIALAAAGNQIVALDEHGDAWTTSKLAKRLRTWREEAPSIAFVIGSADGLAPAVKSNATAVVALSALTLPHSLARVLLAEQLYRAVSVLQGHPYHRE
jgi:23S rRNA (pseudouridine1915-N3)-methyltransferase